MNLLVPKCIFPDSVNFFITVLWVVAIIGVCYDVTKLIEVSGIQVYYEYGCYTITAAGRNLIQNDSYHKRMVIATAGIVETWNMMRELLLH